jgi:hypothetical protein
VPQSAGCVDAFHDRPPRRTYDISGTGTDRCGLTIILGRLVAEPTRARNAKADDTRNRALSSSKITLTAVPLPTIILFRFFDVIEPGRDQCIEMP